MNRFEVLVATVNADPEMLIKKMGITGNAIIANQTQKCLGFFSLDTNHGSAKVINHPTVGVGKNRNMALMFASSDILLFSDDDVVLCQNYEEIVIRAFEKLHNADAVIFNIQTNSEERQQYQNTKTKKCSCFSRMPYGACRIAVHRKALLKYNIHFSEIFGGGCIFPSGEDSIFLHDLIRMGMNVYACPISIGSVSFETSSWFTGANEKYFYGKGAMYESSYPMSKFFRYIYISIRTTGSSLSFVDKIKWLKAGSHGFRKMESYESYIEGDCK